MRITVHTLNLRLSLSPLTDGPTLDLGWFYPAKPVSSQLMAGERQTPDVSAV